MPHEGSSQVRRIEGQAVPAGHGRLTGLALVVLFSLVCQTAWAQMPAAAPKVLQATREAARAWAAQREDAEKLQSRLCKASEDADRIILDNTDDAPARLAELAAAAMARHAECAKARSRVTHIEGEIEKTRGLLRRAALQLSQCGALDEQACLAAELQDDLKATRRLAGLPDVLEVRLAQAPQDADVEKLQKYAAGAQSSMDKLREKTRKVYDLSDEAQSKAVAANWGRLPDKMVGDVTALMGTSPSAARQGPGAVHDAVRQAQFAVNRLLDETLELKKCPPLDADCRSRHFGAADKARAEADRQQAAATTLLDKWIATEAVFAALDTEAADETGQVDVLDLQRRMAFRKFLDANPDAKSYFGGDALGLSAGNANGSSTLRYTMGDKGLLGRYRVTLIGSTPVDPNGRTSLYDNADKLANKTRLDVAVQSTRPAFKGGSILGISDIALGVAYTHTKYSYLVPGATSGKLDAVDRFHDDFSLGGRWAFLKDRGDAKDLLVVSLDRQRAFEFDPASPKIRCPIDPTLNDPTQVVCTNKLLGEPKKKFNTLWGLSYRAHLKYMDVGLKLKFSSTERKTDYELPIYFIRNRDDEKNRFPFSGGISLSRQAGDAAVKWSVFVSTPLSFDRPARSE